MFAASDHHSYVSFMTRQGISALAAAVSPQSGASPATWLPPTPLCRKLRAHHQSARSVLHLPRPALQQQWQPFDCRDEPRVFPWPCRLALGHDTELPPHPVNIAVPSDDAAAYRGVWLGRSLASRVACPARQVGTARRWMRVIH